MKSENRRPNAEHLPVRHNPKSEIRRDKGDREVWRPFVILGFSEVAFKRRDAKDAEKVCESESLCSSRLCGLFAGTDLVGTHENCFAFAA
jgi:hypothetical protein